MVITTTAIAFILLSLGLAFCGWRFLKAFRKESISPSKTGLLLSLSFFATALHNGILGFGALFFGSNSEILYLVSIIAHLFLTLFALIALYTVYYVFFPKKSPYFPIIITIILSATGLFAAINNPSKPFLTSHKGIDWNMNFLFSLSTWHLLLIGISTFFYIFFQLFRKVKNQEIKTLSLIISVLALIGIVNTFVRLIILYNTSSSLRTGILDVGIGVIGAVFIVTFIIIPLIRNRIGKRSKITFDSEKI